jgi:D-erythro-7,8-dihydroneopterin triphosphate epimerase
MATITIKNLRLRTIIGIYEHERKNRQDIILNITIDFDDTEAARTDDVADTVDYKTIKKQIIALVEKSSYNLIEKLVAEVASLIMQDEKVESTTVEIDKPHALRFADSVSIKKTVNR